MQQRTAQNLNKIRKLLAKGITDQREISNLLKISLPTVNKMCQYLASGIEEKIKQKEIRKQKRRAKLREVVTSKKAEQNLNKNLNNEETGDLFKILLNRSIVELTSRLPEMEAAEIADLTLKLGEMFKRNV